MKLYRVHGFGCGNSAHDDDGFATKERCSEWCGDQDKCVVALRAVVDDNGANTGAVVAQGMSAQDYREQAKLLFGNPLKCIEGVLLKSGAAMLEQIHTEIASRDAEIARLKTTLATLIAWLPAELGTAAQNKLLDELGCSPEDTRTAGESDR